MAGAKALGAPPATLHPGTRIPNRAPPSLSPAAQQLTMLSHLPQLLWLPWLIMAVGRDSRSGGIGGGSGGAEGRAPRGAAGPWETSEKSIQPSRLLWWIPFQVPSDGRLEFRAQIALIFTAAIG